MTKILTVNTFKSMFDLKVDDATLLTAITIANFDLFKLLKSQVEFIQQEEKIEEIIHFYSEFPITKDLSIDVGIDDIEIFEYDNNFNVTDVSNLVTNVQTIDIPKDFIVKLTYSETLPRAGKKLAIRINKSKINCFSFENVDNIRRWLSMASFNVMSKDILLHLQQRNISSFNLNGVTVDVSTSNFEDLKKSNEEEMLRIYNRFMPLEIRRTKTNPQWLGHKSRSFRGSFVGTNGGILR